jgi:hypothetical protein
LFKLKLPFDVARANFISVESLAFKTVILVFTKGTPEAVSRTDPLIEYLFWEKANMEVKNRIIAKAIFFIKEIINYLKRNYIFI